MQPTWKLEGASYGLLRNLTKEALGGSRVVKGTDVDLPVQRGIELVE